MRACLACGDALRNESPVYLGVWGPFCSDACRDKTNADNTKLWERATGYASRVVQSRQVTGLAEVVEESDVSRAFVIGYAAGLEDGRGAVGRRTVRK